jgi:hypothetical protein
LLPVATNFLGYDPWLRRGGVQRYVLGVPHLYKRPAAHSNKGHLIGRRPLKLKWELAIRLPSD